MTRKHYLLFLFCIHVVTIIQAQFSTDSIRTEYVTNTLNYLSSDKMGGRVNYSKEQVEAADFLAAEFARFGLESFPGFNNYFISFRTSINSKGKEKLKWNERIMDDSLFRFIPSHRLTKSAKLDDFFILETSHPLPGNILLNNWRSPLGNIIIWVKGSDSGSFSEGIRNLIVPEGLPATEILIVSAPDEPKEMKLEIVQAGDQSLLTNVVGMLPGDSLPQEAIIFSAHYDHVDRHSGDPTGEIFNGANDNASGTTAVLALAQYFAQRKDNRRTLLFCLFAGEEIGLLGSSAFVKLVKPENIKAVLNIEMIGATNASGKNAALVTGQGYSDLYSILDKNLKKEKFRLQELRSDPTYLFQRSDNYPFFLQGIVAHTLFCSDDNDPCYHKPCDDAKRIDKENMTKVIRGIAKSAETLISGVDTPRRR